MRLIDQIRILESECLPEVGRPRPTNDLVRDWRRLVGALDAAAALALEALPLLERDVTGRLLAMRIRALEHRLEVLVEVFEKEDERVAASVLESAADNPSADVPLVQEWMLSRYMIRELAGTLKFRSLGLLATPGFVAIWLLLPFVACMGLQVVGLYRWRGVPFALITILNLLLVTAYFMEARRSERLLSGAGRYLLPQITAALFLGIMEVLSADEAWSLAVLEYRWVRLFTILAFLGTGFVFIREVLLSNQLRGQADRSSRSQRAASVMALVLC